MLYEPFKILVVGRTGNLGSSFLHQCPNFLYPSKPEFDVTCLNAMEKFILRHTIKTVINCSGIVGTDVCLRYKDLAFAVNVGGVRNLIHLCNKYAIKLIHFSSMYSGNENFYSLTKLIAEKEIEKKSKDYVIIRLPWLFGGDRKTTFVHKLTETVKKNEQVGLFSDAGYTAYTTHVARFIGKTSFFPYQKFDLYHEGKITKKTITVYIAGCLRKKCHIFRLKRAIPMKIHPIRQKIRLCHWKEAIKEYLNDDSKHFGPMQPSTENLVAS